MHTRLRGNRLICEKTRTEARNNSGRCRTLAGCRNGRAVKCNHMHGLSGGVLRLEAKTAESRHTPFYTTP